MPKQNIKELYKVRNFEFKRVYRIKIFENTHSIGSEIETIELLDLKDLEQIQREKYQILHIVVKPLTRLGLDKKIKNWEMIRGHLFFGFFLKEIDLPFVFSF